MWIYDDMKIHMYDITSGELVKVLVGHMDHVVCTTFHTNNMELYSGGTDNAILVWSPKYKDINDVKEVLSSLLTTLTDSLGCCFSYRGSLYML
jgi:WD40 repeat protein